MIGSRSILSRTCHLLMAAMFCTVQNSVAQDLQRETAEQFAEKVLDLYETKDIPKLLALSPDGPPPASVLRKYAPGTARYKSLFSDDAWRWQAVQKWQGGISVVRYERTALVEFVKDETEGRSNFVRLEFEGGKWKFELMSEDGADDLAQLQFNRVKADKANAEIVNDLKSVAIRALRAFQAKNVDNVLEISVAEGPLELQFLSAEEKQQPKSDFLFSDEQMAGIVGWDGSVGAVYISETAHAERLRKNQKRFLLPWFPCCRCAKKGYEKNIPIESGRVVSACSEQFAFGCSLQASESASD